LIGIEKMELTPCLICDVYSLTIYSVWSELYCSLYLLLIFVVDAYIWSSLPGDVICSNSAFYKIVLSLMQQFQMLTKSVEI